MVETNENENGIGDKLNTMVVESLSEDFYNILSFF